MRNRIGILETSYELLTIILMSGPGCLMMKVILLFKDVELQLWCPYHNRDRKMIVRWLVYTENPPGADAIKLFSSELTKGPDKLERLCWSLASIFSLVKCLREML